MKQNPYAALKKLIFVTMILVPFIPFILTLGIGYYNFAASLETNTIASMHRIVRDHRQMIESFLMERKADLEFILNTQSFEELQRPENLDRIFEYLQKESHAFVDLGIFDENGLHVAYKGPFQLSGKVYDQAPWFKAVIENGFFISDVFLGYRQVPHFVIAVAQEGQDRRWVIRATIDSHIFNDLVKNVRIGKTGEAYLLDAQGVFQTDRRSGGILMHWDPDRPKYGSVHEGIKTFIETDALGETFLYATTWLKDNSWLLVVRQEKADAFHALRRAAYLIVLTSILGGAGIVAVAFFVTGFIIRRMERMDREKNQLGEQLIRAGRLAEIGEMAAGFAHEINNPLQIIKSEHALVEMILDDLKGKGQLTPSDDLADLEDSIDQIKHQVDRCADVTQAILQFGRKGEPVSQNIDLRSFIPGVVGMVTKKASVHGIAIEQQIAADIPAVHGDPRHLQQVLVNLLNNAIDATIARHGASGGEIRIESASPENRHVEIKVRDNGSGISRENLKKIFTPFFTTKPVGKGTGLGLSVCYGIVQKMGGDMAVASQEEVGTTFTIRLPSLG
ncbi:MAG: ATP-binding protein [Desulfobacterales bacterium]|nr:MAG: ATP-binding protein [Desulfobacterales bacterium]